MAEQLSQVVANPADLVAEFLQSQPLNAKQSFDLPRYAGPLYPEKILMHCPQCGGERPFRDKRPRGGNTIPLPPMKTGVLSFYFQCTFCSRENLTFWVEVNCEEKWIRKVGQRPPWSTDIPEDLDVYLGPDADFYRRAKACLGQGYGLGACVYLQRVLESQVSHLLQSLAELKKQTGTSPEETADLETLLRTDQADNQLALAHKFLPYSFMVEGMNPLKLIHDLLSLGVKALTEEECIQVATQVATCFEYLVSELSHQLTSRERFMTKMRALSAVRARFKITDK
jgi:hypothetical protein